MTEHDRIRMERALRCDRNDLESLREAVVGLQSTDDPSLVPLHDELIAIYEKKLKRVQERKEMSKKEDWNDILGLDPDDDRVVSESLTTHGGVVRVRELANNCLDVDKWEVKQGNRLAKGITKDIVPYADFFAAAYRQYPEVVNNCHEKRRQEFIETLLDSPDFNVLHQSTMSNMLASDMAATQFMQQYDKLREKEGKKEPQTKDERDINTLRAISKALKESQEEVDALCEMTNALGAGDGAATGGEAGLGRIRMQFHQVRSNHQLRRIIELAGRYRLSAQSAQRNKVKHGYDDMIGVELAGDVSRLLPVELSKLGDEDLELDMMRRLVENQAICREYQGLEPQDKGPVVVCVDESGSMQGERIANAKALALAMYWIARHQKRQCILVSFHCGSEHVTCSIDPKKGVSSGAQKLPLTNWLNHFYGGGTDLTVPMGMVPKFWSDYGDIKHGKTDMVIITDAMLSIQPSLKEPFLKWKAKEDVKVQTIVIGARGESIKDISDIVHYVSELSVNSEPVQQAFSI